MRTTQSLSFHDLLNHHLDAFELAWQAVARGEETPPEFSEFPLNEDDSDTSPLLANLIAIDMNWRWKLHSAEGHPDIAALTSHDYFQRFPHLRAKPQCCRDIVCAEYRSRRAVGDAVTPKDMLNSYGETADLRDALHETDYELQLEGATTIPPAIEGFEVAEELGRGGRGVVYKAWEKSLRRFVAIKVLHRNYNSQIDDRNRFRREAETLAKLKHPRVVALHAIGEAEGQLYLIMEWVDGKSLGQMLAEGYLPIPLVVSLMIDVADAVQHAHQRGVLHRDLKPANILVDGSGYARVTDFGLAKELRSAEVSSTWLATQTKAIVGTPCFMPPEQIDASRGELGPSSDVYAIGATLYCLLTGRPPARGSTTWETFRLVLDGTPAPVRSLNPNVSRDLETICMRCLEKNSEQRYASAAEVADELRRLQSGRPILARPLSRLTRLWRWSGRNPREAALWGGLAVSMLALFAVLAVSSIRYRSLFQKEQAVRMQVERTLDRSENNRYIGFIQQALLQYQAHNITEVGEVLDLAVPATATSDRRDWEWHYLRGLLEPGEFHFTVDDTDAPWISVLTATPSQRFLAGGSSVPWYESMTPLPDVGVHVWNLSDGSIHFAKRVPGNTVTAIAISDSGSRLAVLSQTVDRSSPKISEEAFAASGTSLSVFELDSSQLLWETSDLEANYHQLDISADENFLASLSVASFAVRSIDNGSLLWTRDDVDAFQICGTRVRLRTGSTQQLFDLATGSKVAEDQAQDALSCRDFLAAKDMHVLATVEEVELTLRSFLSGQGNLEATLEKEKVLVREWPGSRQVAELSIDNAGVAAFSPDESLLAVGKGSGAIELWDLNKEIRIKQLSGHTGRLSQLKFTQDGLRLISGDWMGNVLVWNLDRMRSPLILGTPGRAEKPMEAFAARDLKSIIAAQWGMDHAVAFETATGQARTLVPLPAEISKRAPGRCAALNQAGTLLAATCEGTPETLQVWDVKTAEEIVQIETAWPIKFVCFDAAGNYLACAAWPAHADGDVNSAAEVTVFDCERREAIFREEYPNARVWRLSLASDLPRLAIALSQPSHASASITENEATTIQLINFESQQSEWTCELPPDATLCLGLCLNAAGTRLATGTLDGVISLWDASDGSLIMRLEGVMENIEDLTFNPSGTRLAGATRKQITLWGTRYGRRILSLPSPVESFDPIFNPQVRFSSDGNLLLTNHYDDTLKVLVGSPSFPSSQRTGATFHNPREEIVRH